MHEVSIVGQFEFCKDFFFMSAIPPTSFPSQIFRFEVFNCFSKPSTKLEAILSQSQDMSSESFTGSLNQAEVLLHVRPVNSCKLAAIFSSGIC